VAIIDIGEARQRLGTRKITATADPSTAEHLGCVGHRRHEVEKFVYEYLKALSESARPEAVRRMGERLILQIASRITADCGRACAIEILEAAALGTTEIAPAAPCRQAMTLPDTRE
jgi:hypothetical protein